MHSYKDSTTVDKHQRIAIRLPQLQSALPLRNQVPCHGPRTGSRNHKTKRTGRPDTDRFQKIQNRYQRRYLADGIRGRGRSRRRDRGRRVCIDGSADSARIDEPTIGRVDIPDKKRADALIRQANTSKIRMIAMIIS